MHLPLKSYYQISHHYPTLHLYYAMCMQKASFSHLSMAIAWTRSSKYLNFTASFLSAFSTIPHKLYMKWKSTISCLTSPSLALLLQKLSEIWREQNSIKLHLTPVSQPCWHVHECTCVSHFKFCKLNYALLEHFSHR